MINSCFIGYRNVDTVGEILKGVRCYFDKALPLMLLYKKERSQFDEAVAESVSPSTVYGAEHLLRLFGKLVTLDTISSNLLFCTCVISMPRVSTDSYLYLRTDCKCSILVILAKL